MQLFSVNIGEERPIRNGKPSNTSGIFKIPTTAAVHISKMGLPGDVIIDVKNHGGVDQAVYIYGLEDYAWWSKELGRTLEPGIFGENLTISGLESAAYRLGDCLQVGAVRLQVTSPRIPCGTLAARMGLPDFVKRYREAERPGLYCRVLLEGDVRAGDPVTVEPYTGATLSLIEMFRDFYIKDLDEAAIRRHLAAPIAVRDRAAKEEQLRKLLAGG